jgi:hypothetical protein
LRREERLRLAAKTAQCTTGEPDATRRAPDRQACATGPDDPQVGNALGLLVDVDSQLGGLQDVEHRIGQAQAMHQAMLAMVDGGTPLERHPAYRAPFVVVGEGAAR